VQYDGEGTYFLDKVRTGVWRLEVYPDAVRLRDPFEQPDVSKIVTRAISRPRTMTIALPDLGRAFTVQPVTAENARRAAAVRGRFTVTPGVYVLSLSGAVNVASLPARIGEIGFAEIHLPPPDWVPALRLFDAGDAPRLAFSRIGDAGRRGLFRVARSPQGQPVFHFEMPAVGGGPEANDYTASLVILDRIRSQQALAPLADTLHVRLRGIGPRQVLHLTLMEDDGTSWSAPVAVDSTWTEQSLPLAAFASARGVLLPEGFPGEWNYWVGPAAGRGGAGDHVRADHVERLQLSLRREDGASPAPGTYGVEVEWVTLGFSADRTGR
jgi:hypothetical protein